MTQALKVVVAGLAPALITFILFLPGMFIFGLSHPIPLLAWLFVSGVIGAVAGVWIPVKFGISQARPRRWVRRLLGLSEVPR